MNIAFATILLLFLLLPGFAIRYSFLQGRYSRKFYKPPITEEIFGSILPAIIIQLTGIVVIENFHNISLETIYYLLIGSSNKTIDFQLIKSSLPLFTCYQLTLILLSLAVGVIVRIIIVKTRLDLNQNLQFLKARNEWYYLFSGDILDPDNRFDFIQIDVLINSDNGNVIYCGILQEYFLSSDGGIDKIYLSYVYRRKFESDEKETPNKEDVPIPPINKEFDERYYNMPGDYFVLFGKEILNINITYYHLEEGNYQPHEELT